MDLPTVRALFDELNKIAAVSLHGLSPQTVLTQQAPEPFETPGFQKAMSILDRVERPKTAGVMPNRLPQLKRLSKKPQGVDENDWDRAKKVGAHGIAGAGVGRFLTEFTPRQVSQKRKFVGTSIGLAAGLTDYAYKQHRKRRGENPPEKSKSAAFSPAMALRSSQQVGKRTGRVVKGLGLKSQLGGALIGRKGQLPY